MTQAATPIEQLKSRLADPVLRNLTVLTDRTRIIAHQRCPRMRLLNYEWKGLGVTPTHTPLYFIFGTAIHVGVTGLLTVLRDRDVLPSRDEARLAIDNAVAHLRNRIALEEPPGMEYAPDASMPVAKAMDMLEFNYHDEQAALLEGLLWSWYFRRLPAFVETYKVLETEEEDALYLGSYNREHYANMANVPVTVGIDEVQVWMQARADALLEERSTNGLYVLSLKSAKGWEVRKQRAGNTDMQGVSETYAIEQRLGRKLLGVQMEYFIKGERKLSSAGVYEQYNPTIRGWVEQANTPGREQKRFWSWKWTEGGDAFDPGKNKQLNYRTHKPFRPWYSLEMGTERWVEALHKLEIQPEAGDPMAEVIISPMPFFRQTRQLRSWFFATSHQEVETKRKAEEFDRCGLGPKDLQDLMDLEFPQYTHSCEYPTQCANHPLCFGVMAPAEIDPLSYQDEENPAVSFKWREPHHAPELIQIQGA